MLKMRLTDRSHRARSHSREAVHAPSPMKACASKSHCISSEYILPRGVDLDRRTLLEALSAQLLSLGFFQCIISPQESLAALEPSSIKLPKAYTSLVEKIASSLHDSIAAESQGAPEAEVRRKADPAKENVKEFVAKWRGNPRVSWHPSHEELLDIVTELGAFYRQAGPRSKLSNEAKSSILAHIGKMEDSLKAPLSSDDGESSVIEDSKLKGLF